MSKKTYILYIALSTLAVLTIFLVLSTNWAGKEYQLSEEIPSSEGISSSEEVPAGICPPCMYWDGKYYYKENEIDAEEVLPDKLGEITEVVSISGMPEKHGQSNVPVMPVGAEIYPMIDGKDLATYADGVWWRLRCKEVWEIWIERYPNKIKR